MRVRGRFIPNMSVRTLVRTRLGSQKQSQGVSKSSSAIACIVKTTFVYDSHPAHTQTNTHTHTHTSEGFQGSGSLFLRPKHEPGLQKSARVCVCTTMRERERRRETGWRSLKDLIVRLFIGMVETKLNSSGWSCLMLWSRI